MKCCKNLRSAEIAIQRLILNDEQFLAAASEMNLLIP